MTALDQPPQAARAAQIKETLGRWFGMMFPLSLEMKILLVIFAVLAFWGLAIFTLGLPAFVWPMKVIVPGMVLGLVVMTWSM